jgi:hypothetical protein
MASIRTTTHQQPTCTRSPRTTGVAGTENRTTRESPTRPGKTRWERMRKDDIS